MREREKPQRELKSERMDIKMNMKRRLERNNKANGVMFGMVTEKSFKPLLNTDSFLRHCDVFRHNKTAFRVTYHVNFTELACRSKGGFDLVAVCLEKSTGRTCS